jgi:hypothetical protein
MTNGKILLTAILLAALAGAVAWFTFRTERPKEGKASTQPSYRMEIGGLRFYGMNGGQQVISIAADRFTLRKGKIGFFSTGLTRTALIENGVIDIYAASAGTPKARGSQPQAGSTALREIGDPAEQTPPESRLLQNIDFGGLLSEETFASLMPVRNIAKIELVPVTVRLHSDRTILTQIIAAQAEVRLQEKKIIFAGNVRVLSSGSELNADQIAFLPETGRLRTDRPFVLKQGRRTLEGKGLSTDIFLNPI